MSAQHALAPVGRVVDLPSGARINRWRRSLEAAHSELAVLVPHPSPERHQAENMLDQARMWGETAIGLAAARTPVPRPRSWLDRLLRRH